MHIDQHSVLDLSKTFDLVSCTGAGARGDFNNLVPASTFRHCTTRCSENLLVALML